MSCEICGRNSCTRSFHSLKDQEDFDNGGPEVRLERELTALRAENERLREDAENALTWQPIATAPKDNKHLLLLARFDEKGELVGQIDFDGRWDYETSGWEDGNRVSYFWSSAYAMCNDPTHWMYQPDWYTAIDAARKEGK